MLTLSLSIAACTVDAHGKAASVDRFTGFLENEELVVAPEIGGRIIEFSVSEGDTVKEGQVLARIDDSLIQLQLTQADADVAAAEAKLAGLMASVRDVDVALAQARLEQAVTAEQIAERSLQDAILLRDNPQELDIKIAQAKATVNESRSYALAAKYQARAADIEAEMWGEIVRDLSQGRKVTLPDGSIVTVEAPPEKRYQANLQWNLAGHRAWQAWQKAAQADGAAQQAKVALDNLLAQRDNRQEAEMQVVAAENERDQAHEAVKQAQAAMDAVRTGPTKEQIAAAEADVQRERAVRDALAVRVNKTIIKAPKSGVISAQFFHEGEVVGPGQRLLNIALLNQLTITIYVPAGMIDLIHIGDQYPLTVDTNNKTTYDARVISISDTPEFTMRQSQNVAERAAVVYAITLQVLQPDNLLRPGLPADILIQH